MIFSLQQLWSNDQAITATAISTNVIDTGVRGTPFDAAAAVNGDIGKGNPICFLAQVTADFDNLTTLAIALETSDNADLSSSTVLTSITVPLASLVAGYQIPVEFVPKGAVGRYLGLRYTVVGTAPTAGTITAGVTLGNQTNVTGA